MKNITLIKPVKEENKMAENIIANMANVDNAKKFLDDLLFDAENCGNLESTVDGLMMLFEVFGNSDSTKLLAEELQIHLYGWTSHHDDAYSAYCETVKAGKNYQERIEA